MPFISETLKPVSVELDFLSGIEDITLMHESPRGKLYLATRYGKRFVLKTAASDRGKDIAMLKREYELMRMLSHPNVICAYSYHPASVIGPCIVMEYADGVTLREFLESKPSLKLRINVFEQILNALEHIHEKGIIHNDLSVENVMVCKAGNKVKVIDFGFADDVATHTSKCLGCTRAYASPELLGKKNVDQRSDIWSIGILAKDIFGKRFFRISKKCRRTNPDHRYQSIATLRADFVRSGFTPLAIILFTAILLIAGPFILTPRKTAQLETPPPIVLDSIPAKDSIKVSGTTGNETEGAPQREIISVPVRQSAPERQASKPSKVLPANKEAEPEESDIVVSGVDLSANEVANSYIVSNPGEYSFRADVKGCSYDSLDCQAYSVEILWESFGDMNHPVPGDLIKTAELEGGRIKFTTANPLRNGNAVIAAKDSSNNILWSWHIWICRNYEPEKTGQEYENNRQIFMDRNLGATSASPGSIYSLGLMYQWGRKDPFLNLSSYDNNYTENNRIVYYQAFSTANWPMPEEISPSTTRTAFTRLKPMTFIANKLYIDSGDDRWYDDRKGRQDPCPPGWRVPGKRIWQESLGFSNDSLCVFDQDRLGVDFGRYSQIRFSQEEKVWYPATGVKFHIAGTLLNVTTHGYYWTSSIYRTLNATALIFRAPGVLQPSHTLRPHHALAVRCMKDNK